MAKYWANKIFLYMNHTKFERIYIVSSYLIIPLSEDSRINLDPVDANLLFLNALDNVYLLSSIMTSTSYSDDL